MRVGPFLLEGTMPRYRATVWTLSALAETVEGDAAIRRHIVERFANSKREFEASVRDDYISDPDNHVWLGPISEKPDQQPFPRP